MILTVARDEGLRQRLATVLGPTGWGASVTHADTVGEALEVLRGSGVVRAIVVGPTPGLDGASELSREAAGMRTPPPVLLIGRPTTELLRAAMRAGIRDVLQPDFGDEDLLRTLAEAGVDSDGPQALDGLTVAVFSSKGGVGTSVIASNLAIRLADRTGQPTTLLDLDLASADQAIMHGQSPRWTIQDLADGTIARDPESLAQVLLPIAGTGARLLPGPVDPALAETISGQQVASIIAAARAEAPVAVLDTSSSFDDRTLAALDAADCVVVTSSLDVAALRGLTVSLQTLARLGVADDQLCLVLVRADSKSGLLVSDVENAIGRQIDVGVPSTRSVPRSVNEGTPLAAGSGRSSVVSAVDEIVKHVLALAPTDLLGTEDEDSTSGLFSWGLLSRGSKPAQSAARPSPAQEEATPEQAAPEENVDEQETESGEPTPSGNVLPLDGRREDPQAAGQRVVRSGRSSETPAAPQDPSPPEEEPRSTPSIGDLPPPRVVQEGDDEQPRRRRRR